VTRARLLAAALLAALAASAAATVGLAGNPFYAVPPTPRKECHNVNHCVSVIGPWVAVPAGGEATYLLDCPKRHGFVGGTDTRASSKSVVVWWDAQVGAPVRQAITTGPFLLFHAKTTNGRPGSFQPTIGCIKFLQPTNGRSTVSARQSGPLTGTTAGTPLDLHAKTITLVATSTQRKTVYCFPHEHLVGSWDQLAFIASGPPPLNHIDAVVTQRVLTKNSATVVVHTARSLPFVPLAEVQIGAMCTT
jgi:hypothetical protein